MYRAVQRVKTDFLSFGIGVFKDLAIKLANKSGSSDEPSLTKKKAITYEHL
jgi:hypothetical protein